MRPAAQAWRFGPRVIVLPVAIAAESHVGVGAKGTIERPPALKMRERLAADRDEPDTGAVGRSRLTRATAKSLAGAMPSTERVFIFRKPIS